MAETPSAPAVHVEQPEQSARQKHDHDDDEQEYPFDDSHTHLPLSSPQRAQRSDGPAGAGVPRLWSHSSPRTMYCRPDTAVAEHRAMLNAIRERASERGD